VVVAASAASRRSSSSVSSSAGSGSSSSRGSVAASSSGGRLGSGRCSIIERDIGPCERSLEDSVNPPPRDRGSGRRSPLQNLDLTECPADASRKISDRKVASRYVWNRRIQPQQRKSGRADARGQGAAGGDLRAR